MAEREDSTQSFSGIQIAESVADTQKAIESGDWAGGVLGAVGTGLDALGMALDPFGAIFSAGVGWLIEHVGPVSDALDSLTGDPDEIKAHSETWKNVSAELEAINTEMKDLVKADTASWLGDAGDAYRKRSEDTANLIAAAKSAADGAADGIGTAGEVVAAVRTLVRDIIAELVGHLISWALQVVCTLGIALAWVVPQVVAEVAKVAAKIADITTKLIQAMKKLSPLLKKLGDSFGDTKTALDKIKADNTKNDGPASTNAQSADGSGSKGDGNAGSGSKGEGLKDEGGKGDGAGSPGPAGTRSQNADRPTNKPNNPRDWAQKQDGRCTDTTEPVDLATGEMVMVETDLEILSSLSLVLERMYVSSYRAGRWFGAGWSSTLDQRLEVDDEHVCYFSPDGMILVYPLPSVAAEELPIEGPRWPLRVRDDGGYSIAKTQEVLHFRRLGKFERVLPLIAVEGAEGRRIDVEPRRFGPPKALQHSDGYRVEIDSANERVTAVRVLDPANNLNVVAMSYGYDEKGRLAEVINSSGKALKYLYDDAGRLTEWQDRNGFWFRYVYDENGRCVRTVGQEGYFDSVFTYSGNVTTYKDSLGGVKEFEFNDRKQIVRQMDALGNITRSAWDRYDRLLSRTDPLGRTTRYEYDRLGRPSEITRADGSVVRLVLADDGTVESIAVNDGERTWNRHYRRGERPDPFGGKIGLAAELHLDTHASGQAGAGEPSAGEVNSPHLTRDLFGRITESATADGERSRHGWTVEGRPLWQQDARGGRQQWRYDPEGNQIARVNALGATTASEYGPFGVVLADVDATGARTVRTYDTELKLISVTNPQGQTWSYTYDLAGRVVEERDYDGRVLRYGYDAAGQLVTSFNGVGETTEFTYDVLGNLVEWRAPSGPTTYAYSPVGNLVRAACGDAILVREWDDQGRITAERTNDRSIVFSYDDANNAVRRTTPSGAESVWSYDESGSPRELILGAHAIEFEYDGARREIARSIDNSAKLVHEYDANLLVSQVLTPRSGRDVMRRRFEYRADGNLVGRTDDLFGQARFELDSAGRVVEVVAPGRREQYSYDGLANVVAADGLASAESGTRRYQGNTLVEAGSVGYRYDSQGRMVLRSVRNEGNWRYEWDSYDRLVAVTAADGTVWRYRYDALGRRIAKQRMAPGTAGAPPVVAEQTEFVWDGGTLVEQLHTYAQGNWHVVTWEYHPDTEVVVAQLERLGAAEVFHFVVTDSLGTPTDLVTADGTLTWHNETSLWGNTLPDPRARATTPLRFPGQYADVETGLNYNVYRYYDPATGRYLSQDPLGLAPGPNPVAYVSNPNRETDPLGLMCPQSGGKRPAQTGATGNQAGNVRGGKSGKPNKSENVDHPDLGLNQGNVIPGKSSTSHTITLPDGSEHKIISTPMSKIEGYHGIKPEHYDSVLDGGVHRPDTGTGGNTDADWKAWYLAEDSGGAGNNSFSESTGKPGAVLKYETPPANGPMTLHSVPQELVDTTSGKNSDAMSALKDHFGIGQDKPLMDGLAAQNGAIRTSDGVMNELIVPWDKANGGKVEVAGYPDAMDPETISDKPGRGSGLMGRV
ncbi:RHS repeat-associated core domain-containing protein [Saccharopolyspora sp. NPDC049426]|uniref:RHS repeat-associated core domain-containing protein n=1 Tax=Saccharopolyspora sp. NPDC049426 TaxID=3155652 RepID=UPI003422BB5B